MKRSFTKRPSPAMTVASMALFVALGGTGFAALSTIPDAEGVFHGCVDRGTGALRVVSRASACRRPRSFRREGRRVVDRGELAVAWNQRGAPGAPGTPGAAGAPGAPGKPGDPGRSATALWAVVNSDGTTARGSHASSTSRSSTGAYHVVFNQDVSQCSALATIGPPTNGVASGAVDVANLDMEPRGLYIETYNLAGALADRPFHVAVFC